jgi:hypothetical protein
MGLDIDAGKGPAANARLRTAGGIRRAAMDLERSPLALPFPAIPAIPA